MHPGEKFYPEGVHWDDPIARGTLPELLSNAAVEFGARPAIEFRDRAISYTELEALTEVAASAFLHAGYGKSNSVALFLGNSPDHPVNFFGALLSHGNLTSAVSIYDVWSKTARMERNAIERVICVLPLFHIFALTVVMLSSIRRGNLISLHQRFDLEAVMRDIEVKRATAFPGVPTMWIAIASLPDLDKRDFSSLVSCGSGGAPLPVEVAKILERKTTMKLKSGWGMTDTCSPGTGHPKEGPDKPGSIGLMLPGIEMDVVALDDPKKLMPVGEVGEIRIRGPNVTKGYWNRPQETAEAFVGDRFLTGDIGYMDADGYFYLVDRKKDMIISGGFNVYPQMIEQAIYTHPSVQEVIVIGIPDDYRGEAAKAFVTLRAGAAPFTADELRAFLTGKLGKHELPAAVEFVKELPRTPVGKLSRHELRKAQPSPQTKRQIA